MVQITFSFVLPSSLTSVSLFQIVLLQKELPRRWGAIPLGLNVKKIYIYYAISTLVARREGKSECKEGEEL